MKRKYIPVLFSALCGILALAAGCSSLVTPEGNATPTATVTNVASAYDALRGMALSPQDLPAGYSLVYRGEMRPGDPNCTAEVCFLQGYFISASNGTDNASTIIDQAIVIYNVNAMPETLRPVLDNQLQVNASGGNFTALADPGIGDVSALYRFSLPTDGEPIEGYLVIFGKGNLYEIIMVRGPDASETMVVDLAKKALG
ncbi:MAG: hypothetical protein HGA55_02970 [Methanoregulaceae archaeon]|nr:hypothetical protein [Methanoregulaceae archaeon]